MDVLSRIGYRKILVLVFTLVFAYFIFYERNFQPLQEFLSSMGYFGFFISGLFYSSSFTAAPATAVLLVMADGYNIYLAALVSGLGALAGNLIMFRFIRQSSLGRHSFGRRMGQVLKKPFHMFFKKSKSRLRKYSLMVLVGFMLAAPFPDEIGVSILAKMSRMSQWKFSVLSFALNTLGIFAILLIGASV